MTKSKKQHGNLKTFLLSLLVILAVVGGVYAAGLYQIYHFNNGMVIPEGEENLLARFPISDEGYFYSPSGKKVILDMGSRHCFITRETLEQFKEEGYPAEEYPTLIVTTDHSGRYRIYTRKVIMPMLLTSPSFPDSTLRLDNVELLISDKEAGNIMGMDCLERFVIERDAETGDISLLRHVPENFAEVCGINGHDSNLGDLFGYSRRVYIPLQVNDEPAQNYYLDTGVEMLDLELVQPKKNIDRATSAVAVDSVSGLLTQRNCRILIGNRMRFGKVTYVDSLHTDEYSVNPFRLFNRNIVLDLPNHKLYYHNPAPTASTVTDDDV